MKQHLDFIVIGAQKAGTTSLFEYLKRHPEICVPVAKEVPYFSHEANYSRDWNEYLRKAFVGADPACRWGTVTPHYMVGGLYDAGRSPNSVSSDERTVPLRIRQRLPDVRLIAIVRDPVERAFSHHTMTTMNGWEHRPFRQAISELLGPEALAAARRVPHETTGYVTWGEYGRILAGYRDVFPADQMLVLYMNDLKSDPQGVLRRIFEFLGVAPEFTPDNLGRIYRPSGDARRFRRLDLSAVQAVAAANPVARGLWHALPEPARRRVDRRFDRINYLTGLWNRRRARSSNSSDPETTEALRAHYQQDDARLLALLGQAPPWSAPARLS